MKKILFFLLVFIGTLHFSRTNELVKSELLDRYIYPCHCLTLGYSECVTVNKSSVLFPSANRPANLSICSGFEIVPGETCEIDPNLPECNEVARHIYDRSVKDNVLKEAVKTGEPKFKYTMFPNPFLEHLTIQMENTKKLSIGQNDHLTISIFDITGHSISRRNSCLIKKHWFGICNRSIWPKDLMCL